MTDRIFIRNLAVFAHHGVNEEETRLGQRFFFDVDCHLNVREVARHDDYSQAVCYGAVCKTVKDIAEGEPLALLETLADRAARAILAQYPELQTVRVEVRKPSAPIPAVLDYVGVEVTRTRND